MGGVVTVRQGGQDFQLAVVSKNEEKNIKRYHQEYDKHNPAQKRRAEDDKDAPAKCLRESKDEDGEDEFNAASTTQQSVFLRTAAKIEFRRLVGEVGVEAAK